MSGDEGREGGENHLGTDLDGSCRRLRAVLPELVDIGIAAAGGSGDGAVCPDRRSGLCLPADGRSLDEPPAKAQPDG